MVSVTIPQIGRAGRIEPDKPIWTDRLAARFVFHRMLYPTAPAIDILDLLMDASVRSCLTGRTHDIHPGTPLGQIIASIFDRGMEPDDWAAWTNLHADIEVRKALLDLWQREVLQAVVERYCGASAVGTPA